MAPPEDKFDEQLADQAEWNQDFFGICAEPGADSGMPGVLSETEVTTTYDWLRQYNILEDDVDTTTIVDMSVAEEALKDLDVAAWADEYLAENPT